MGVHVCRQGCMPHQAIGCQELLQYSQEEPNEDDVHLHAMWVAHTLTAAFTTMDRCQVRLVPIPTTQLRNQCSEAVATHSPCCFLLLPLHTFSLICICTPSLFSQNARKLESQKWPMPQIMSCQPTARGATITNVSDPDPPHMTYDIYANATFQ